ncbi:MULTISPECIES: hypothetical protein [Halococcus]|uniref:hypothetical protein n=1 Tax=Halococcus TaxID=2249 RepID=UPI0012695390|nr:MULTISPECIES: hypothetical protein [Halococcus]
MSSIDRGRKVDFGYGATPEDALLAVLQRQPAFDPHDAEYIGGRPDFMDVDTKYIHEHDWSEYDSSSNSSLVPDQDDGSIVQIKRPYDIGDLTDKIRITISNIWAEVNYREDDRANVKFQFSVDIDESQLTGERRVTGELDKTWKCERISTEPK